MTDDLRLAYDQARALFPLLPQYYETIDLPADATTHIQFLGLNVVGMPRFGVVPGRVLTREEGFHESGHAYKALLEKKYPYRQFGQEYWDFRGFPGTYAKAKSDAEALYSAGQFMPGWIADPNESWAEAFRIAVALAGTEKTADFGKTIVPAATRAFFQSLSPTVSVPIPPTSPPQQKDPVVEWQGPVPQTNYAPGRSGNPVALVVDHWMGTPGLAAGTLFASAVARFMSPNSGVSAHYLVSTTGRIVQLVRDEDTAYHAGDWNTNQLAIGIEHEANSTLPPSDALYAASAWLHRKLSQDHGIRLVVGDTVIPHRQVVPTACPGTLDLDHIVALASMEEDMTPAQEAKLDRVIALLEAREPLVWIARSQRTLDVETGKTWNPNTPPIDPRIKQ